MSLIKITGATTKKLDILPEGKYEVYLDTFDQVHALEDGTLQTKLVFRIRDDIEQPGQKLKIFSLIRSSWDWMINGLALAVGIPTDTEFESLDDFLKELKGKSLVVKVRHRNNPKDENKPYVNVSDFYPTTNEPYIVIDESNVL